MAKFLILFYLLFAGIDLWAQSPNENLSKYWNYRDRFLGKDGFGGFISVGPDQGQSIPASGRNINCDCEKDYFLMRSKAPKQEGSGILKWGDATVYLGYYLAMLSMEYENLRAVGADTRATRRELYYALTAYERLDSLAEVSLGLPAQVNGFFLRDDVPLNFSEGEYGGTDRRFRHKEKGGYDCIGSDYSKGTRAVDNGSYVSQDQAISLLFGFSFVKRFAGDARYPAKDTASFGNLAQIYSHLIVQYMSRQKWKLKSPDGQKIPGRWGGDARAFSELIAEAAEAITEGKFKYQYRRPNLIGRLAKGTFTWAFGVQGENNHGMIFHLMMLSEQWSAERFAERTRKADNVLYALADAVLNKRKLHNSIQKNEFEDLINTAPWDGPCTGTVGCEAPEGWRSSDLWWHANHKNGDPYGRVYEYTGLDFMFLYNLYHYYYRDQLPQYQVPKKINKRGGVEAQLKNEVEKNEN